MNKENKCTHTNCTRVEVMWDYDGVLYTKCNDCWLMKNAHTGVEFDEILFKEPYWFTYQFKDGKLVWYSQYTAEWLYSLDDLTAIENQLWGSIRDWKRHFIALRNLEYPHILNILRDYNDWRMNVKPSYINYFNSIKVLEWKKENYQNDIVNELKELVI
jgi:hypothetical protein